MGRRRSAVLATGGDPHRGPWFNQFHYAKRAKVEQGSVKVYTDEEIAQYNREAERGREDTE